MNTAMVRRAPDCASDLTIDRWLLGELPKADHGRRLEEHLRGCAQCGSRVRSLRELYSHQRSEHRSAGVRPRVVPAPAPSPGQHGVAQVIILRDGLLVGTEVFTPGEWFIGSDPRSDLVLSDASVRARHARLVFRSGRAAINDLGGGLFVNGFKVTTAELRPIDEVSCGPYLLRTRVIAERWGEEEQKTQVCRLRPIVPLGLAPSPPPSAPTSTVVTAPAVATPRPLAVPAASPLRLELRLLWGDACQAARLFGPGPVIAAERESAAMPVWGFELGECGRLLADGDARAFRLFVPPGAAVERCGARGWEPVERGEVPSVAVEAGAPLRLRKGPMTLLATVRRAPEATPKAALEPGAWKVPVLSALLFLGLMALIHFHTVEDGADFVARPLPRSLVKVSFPEKKPPPPPAVLRAKKRPERTPPAARAQVQRQPPRHQPPDPSDALARLRKSAIANITSALDRVGKPTRRGVASANPLALPSFGDAPAQLGLSDHGGAGIGRDGWRGSGELRTGGLGRTAIGGRVVGVIGRSAGGVKTSIDRDQVAKVINAHLADVQRCYEAALITNPGLHGRVTLEWVITVTGSVRSARSKASTLQSPSVESCILQHLKRWQFPQARGGDVTVTYPFVFDAVAF